MPVRATLLFLHARAVLTVITLEMTIIFDSGVRTGADVFKAIALGAHVVAISRSLLAVRPSRSALWLP